MCTKILVADDSGTMRKIIVRTLNSVGFKDVVEAADGLEAFKLFQANPIDLVLTDWNMPGMAGLDLLKHVRADERLKKLPVLMLTAEASREQIVAAAQAGVSGYVIKPFTAVVLKEKLEKILAARPPKAD